MTTPPSTATTAIARALAHAQSLLAADRADAALEALRTALAFQPDSVPARRLIVEAHIRTGNLAAADTALSTILRANPTDIAAQALYARVMFLMERWPEAWDAYQIRFALMENPPRCFRRSADGTRRPTQPWSGEGNPERLLVLSEQGLGDTLQFVRFLPDIIKRGIRPSLVVPERLMPLLAGSLPNVDLLPAENPVQGLPAMPWIPLLNLPMALALDPAHYTAPQPYLKADATRVTRWKQRLPKSGLRIGIAWTGNPANTTNAQRSMPLEALAPLAATSAHVISLQTGAGTADALSACPFADRLIRFDDELDRDGAFVDTAAIMMNLDMIVTVDTSIAHLAGALGRKTAILLPRHVADWRWMLSGSDTIWYPTARLYRQHVLGDWSGAVGDLVADIGSAPPSRKVRRLPASIRKPQVPVSVGELLDKLSILELKVSRITDATARGRAADEFASLSQIARPLFDEEPDLQPLFDELHAINGSLWDIENRMRAFEAARRFDDIFVANAREVYRNNDRRAAVKRRINELARSELVEVKDHSTRAA